jgi:hypothetical protein
MPLGQENAFIQDQSDLNETVVQSFPAHPKVRHPLGTCLDALG